MNGGFFAFRNEIFDVINDGEELVEEPFQRLIEKEQLSTYAYDGFWSCMDTFKEKQDLDDLYASGAPPWALWERGAGSGDLLPTQVERTRHVSEHNGGKSVRNRSSRERASRQLTAHDLAAS